MAGTYSTDLTTIGDGTTGTAVELSAFNAGTFGIDTDAVIQGTNSYYCVTGKSSGNQSSVLVDFGSNISITGGQVLTMWVLYPIPSGIQTYANNGYQILVATATTGTSYRAYRVSGSDLHPYGGWLNFAVDLRNTPDGTNGGASVTSNRYFGAGWINAVSYSRNPLAAVDAVRYGNMTMTATGGTSTSVNHASPLSSSSANFPQMANYNDWNTGGTPTFGAAKDSGYHRFGQCSDVGGYYSLKGKINLGSAGSSVYFNDTARVVTFEDSFLTYQGFNAIQILNAASTVIFDSMSFGFAPIDSGIVTSPAAATYPDFTVVDNASVSLTGCSFTDFSLITLKSNSTVTGCTFRRCDTVFSEVGTTITGNTFANFQDTQTINISNINNLSTITGNTFIAPATGSNYAVYMDTLGSGTYNVTWDNTLSGYVAGTTGNNVGTSSPTGREAIYITGGGVTPVTYNISIAAGASIPSIAKGSNVIVNVIAGQRTFNVTNVVAGSEVRLYKQSDLTELAGVESIGSVTGGDTLTVSGPDVNGRYSGSYTYSYSADTPIYVVVHSLSYLYDRKEFTLEDADSSLQISQVADRNYSNP